MTRPRASFRRPAPAPPFADQPPRPLSQTRRKRGGQKKARGPEESTGARHIHRLTLALMASFFLIGLASGYWGSLRREALLERPDNPRRALLEQRLQRGTIYDRNGEVLAESVGEPGDFVRRYPYPDLAPVVGYASAFFGSAGVEAAADGVLHGDAGRTFTDVYWRDVLLNAPPPGRDVRLSIDLNLQKVADATLGSHTGAVVLLDTTTGEILALASHPTFDPNDLAAQWESLVADERAPLLNRATLALYQPGGALQPIVLAAALQAGYADLTAPFASADAAVGVGDLTLGCLAPSSETSLTLAEAFQAGCPWPFAELGGQMGAGTLNRLFQGFRLFEAPALPIPTTSASPALLASEAPMPALVRARVAAIGQGTLTITPLHLALVAAAIARHGEMPSPHLLVAAQNPEGAWEAIPSLSHPIAAIGSEYADAVKALMADGHSAIALTSTGGKTLAWFSSFAPFDDSRYAVAVLLEDGDVEVARKIGQELLRQAAQK